MPFATYVHGLQDHLSKTMPILVAGFSPIVEYAMEPFLLIVGCHDCIKYHMQR